MKQQFLIIAIILLASCTRSITGTITAVNKDTIEVKGKQFIVLSDTLPGIGKQVTFTPTKNRKKVNARIAQ